MASDSTTRWPLLDERAPFATASRRTRPRKPARSIWLLTGLAFVCGGLVSAAGFSIGWRHQAQRNTAAQSALSAAQARTHKLEQKVDTLQSSLGSARTAAATAAAAERSVARAAARVDSDATTSGDGAASISSGAGTLSAAATRIASELKTLNSYLTTTPPGDLDPGYISNQTAYLAQQLTRLRGDSADLGSSVTSFEATLHRLGRDAAALKTH
jgi:uncharacterized phage infection (PIP) family protein YhgE